MRPFHESRALSACIFSRITASIQLEKTTEETITDIMSRTQFHSSILLKLRHAWLNLWNEHMTTGRINQIACFFVQVFGVISAHNFQKKYLDKTFLYCWLPCFCRTKTVIELKIKIYETINLLTPFAFSSLLRLETQK